MKKIFFAFFILTSAYCNAQFLKKGSIIGDGSFSLATSSSSTNGVSSKTNTLSISPFGGYTILNNLVTGVNLATTFSKTDGGSSSSKYNYLAIGPVVRYYFNNGFFLHSDINFGTGKNVVINQITNTPSKVKNRLTNLKIV